MATERLQRRINILLDEAEDAIAKSDWELVRDRAQNVLALDPDNADALALITAADRALGKLPDSATSQPEVEATPSEPPSPAATAPDAVRRQLTVMFCDLQGSTALSQQLDPEDLREVIRGYQEVCAGAVGRFDGHIAKYLGDGLLIYFGYPQAHEDDPQRALRAGLAILEDMKALNTRLREDKGFELVVRIGVHTGLVVAGEMGGGDTVEALAIVGETPNIAARLQEAAEPNTVVVSNITANLVQGFFLCEALGFHELKGISEPMELFRVLSESAAQTRFEVAASRQLTPLVGREQEVGLLLDRWEQAKEGLGQVVLLSGEPGIGKSRLIEALTERLSAEPHSLRRLRCSAYHQNSALHPFAEYLISWLGFGPEHSSAEKLSKLEGRLTTIDFPLAEAVPLLAGLLSLQLDGRFAPLTLTPEGQRTRTLELLVELLLDSADEHPVFIVVEDLNWSDPSTLAVLSLLLDQVPTAKVLALLSFRPEFSPPWGSRAYVTQVMLNRLTRRLAGDMVDGLTSGRSLPSEILNQIAAKSDGVPLFVEELTHMVVESDLVKVVDDHYELTGPLPPLAIPSTLQDSLTARLDRLGDAREVVHLGAVLGREFSYKLMEDISPLNEGTLRRHIQRLVDSDFFYQRGLPPEATYTFKHALIQDAAYESLLRSTRQQYHQQAARSLEERFPEMVASQPELVAHHYTEAGLIEQAVSYWQLAGERALDAYAHEEALTHFQRGMTAKGVTLEGSETAEDAIAAGLLFGLGRAQVAVLERHQFHTALSSFSRAFDYYVDAGDIPRAVAIAEYPTPLVPGDVSEQVQLLPRALALVPPDSHEAGRLLLRFGDPGRILGPSELKEAEEALGRALTISRREGDMALEMRTLNNIGIVTRRLYRHQQGLDNSLQAIELARRINDPRAEAVACFWAVMAQSNLGDLEGMRLNAAAGLHAAERLHDRSWLALLLWCGQMAAKLEGAWQAARDFSDRGLTVSPRECRLLYLRILVDYEVGEFNQGEAYLEKFLDVMRQTSPRGNAEYSFASCLIPMVASIVGNLDRSDVAEEAAKAVISTWEDTGGGEFIQFAQTGLGLLAVIRGDAGVARKQYAVLESHRGLMVVLGGMANDRLLGLLAKTLGNLDQAIVHFKDALTFCRNSGYRPELAWSCCDYADTLLQRNGEGDRAKANALLDESLAISSELGMRPLMERVLSRREILGA